MEGKSERLLFEQVLFEGIEEMVFVVRSEQQGWVYEFINQAVVSKTEMAPSSIGKSFSEVHGDKKAKQLIYHYDQVKDSETSLTFEDSYFSSTGELRYSKSRLTALRDELGNCTHVVSVVIDITEEKKAKGAREKALNHLEESNAKYRSLFQQNGDAVFILTLQGRLNGGNEMAKNLMNRPMAEIEGAEFSVLVEPEDHELLRKAFEEAVSGVYKDYRLNLISKDGRKISCLVKFIPIAGRNRLSGFYLMAKDLTELEGLLSKYLTSEKNLRVIAENVYDVILLLNRRREFLYVSPSSTEVFGISSEKLMNQRPFFNVHPDDLPLIEQRFDEAAASGRPYSLQLRVNHSCRGWIWTEMNGTPVYENNLFSRMVMIVRDISDQKKHEQQLEYYAFHDSLTNLPNRRYFQEYSTGKLNERAQVNGNIGLAVIDLDDFKRINDEYGHEAGDEILKSVAERLTTLERPAFLPARMGGDEFIILLEEVQTEKDAQSAYLHIHAMLSGEWNLGSMPVTVDFSVGVAVVPACGETLSSIIKRADEAMYKAKKVEQGNIELLQP